MPELVKHFKEFFREKGRNEQVVYVLNSDDDQYYTVDRIRVDTEGDVVIDISSSG